MQNIILENFVQMWKFLRQHYLCYLYMIQALKPKPCAIKVNINKNENNRYLLDIKLPRKHVNETVYLNLSFLVR